MAILLSSPSPFRLPKARFTGFTCDDLRGKLGWFYAPPAGGKFLTIAHAVRPFRPNEERRVRAARQAFGDLCRALASFPCQSISALTVVLWRRSPFLTGYPVAVYP